MKGKICIIVMLAGALSSCAKNQPEATSPAEPELPTIAVTLWTDGTELFMEYPALVAGEDAGFAVHLTVLHAVPAGDYFWNIAAVGPQGALGPYSEPRRFRITSQKIRDREDTTPPPIQITEKVQTGSMLILNGKTEPGAVLWVDDEKVEVSEDGSFYAGVRLPKEGVNEVVLIAQDAAGNQQKVSQKAFVDSF